MSAPDVDLATSLTGGRLSGCWTPTWRRIALPLCGGLDLAALRVEPIGLRDRTPALDLYVGAHAGFRLLWRVRPTVGLGLDVGGPGPLDRRPDRVDIVPPREHDTPEPKGPPPDKPRRPPPQMTPRRSSTTPPM